MPAVPSFILKKLYVKKSLKNVDDGFMAELKNVLADATITEPVKLTVDNRPVAPESIELTVEDKTIKSTEISADNPIEFNLHTTVVVKVKGDPLPEGQHKLEFETKTKEYGGISFAIKDSV